MSNDESKWIEAEKKKVSDYLKAESVEYQRISEYPVFYVHPDLALWAIEANNAPGWVAWWAVSGDCPTDYIGSDGISHPAEALQAIADVWHEAAEYMLRGEQHPHFSVETTDDSTNLGELLRNMSIQLSEYAQDQEIWEG